MNSLLVADSGPLIALSRLELLGEARSCFDHLWVPEMVYAEVTRKSELPDARRLSAAAAAGMFEVVVNVPATVGKVSAYGLDPGETMAIALALQEHAVVLIDERRGRMASRDLGLDVIGTLGVLALLREKNLLARIAVPIARLMASGYYLPDELVAQLLRRFGESSNG